MKRASIEFNFHALYSNFLDVLKVPELNRMVVRETFRNIKVLLHSDKGIANFSDRSLLKNLGHFLGMLTLARNKPILQNDMDLKALLAEAYHKGQQELLYVVPFIAKVLEACAKSKVSRQKWFLPSYQCRFSIGIQTSKPMDNGPHECPGRTPPGARLETEPQI